jgi:hypothetical protein
MSTILAVDFGNFNSVSGDNLEAAECLTPITWPA